MSVHNISFRTIVHATESEDRVKSALSHFLFNNDIDSIKTEGHFGNSIIILQARLKGRDCSRFIDLLRTKLTEHDLTRLRNERCERIDEDCNLHIRFDKQAAYNGIIQLAATSDTIVAELKIKAYPAKREKAIAIAETIFFLMSNV